MCSETGTGLMYFVQQHIILWTVNSWASATRGIARCTESRIQTWGVALSFTNYTVPFTS